MMRRVGLDWIGARPSGRSLIWVTGGPAGPDMGREDLAVRHSHITMQHPGGWFSAPAAGWTDRARVKVANGYSYTSALAAALGVTSSSPSSL